MKPPLLEHLLGDALSRKPDLPEPPPWRRFEANPIPETEWLTAPPMPDKQREAGEYYVPRPIEAEVVYAALLLRRPILLTGLPGTGKTSLAFWAAHRLDLGRVLHWPITSRSTRKAGLYDYDAIGRLQGTDEATRRDWSARQRAAEVGRYVSLGPLGTALLPWKWPRVLVIDEIDKGDIDLPNDLLHVFERGEDEIAELKRLPPEPAYDLVEVATDDGRGRFGENEPKARLRRGLIRCHEFPLVFLTSNGEREFPPAFLRRCLRLEMEQPGRDRLEQIIRTRHQSYRKSLRDPEAIQLDDRAVQQQVQDFLELRKTGPLLSPDQLLNAFFLESVHGYASPELRQRVLRPLDQPDEAKTAPVEGGDQPGK